MSFIPGRFLSSHGQNDASCSWDGYYGPKPVELSHEGEKIRAKLRSAMP